MRRPWFGAKSYGYGLGPKSPEGWAATGIYALLMILAPVVVTAEHGPAALTPILLTAFSVAFLILLAFTSDDKPWRWRWGGRD